MTHTSNRIVQFLLAVVAVAFVAVPAAAQNGYLQLGDIAGEATDRDHRDWIDLLSVSHAWDRPDAGATGQTRRRGQANIDGLVVVKAIDAATPKLIEALARGTVLQSATIDWMRGGSVALKYELTNVRVTSHAMDDGKEHVSLAFERMTITHPPSSIEVTIDLASGR